MDKHMKEYIDLAHLRAKDYEERLRQDLLKMEDTPNLPSDERGYHSSSPTFYQSRTEAQFIEERAKELHAWRGRLHQALWQIERNEGQVCLAHCECSTTNERGTQKGWDYELLLEPFGQWYDQWRVVLSSGDLPKETVFAHYNEARSFFFRQLEELPQSRQ